MSDNHPHDEILYLDGDAVKMICQQIDSVTIIRDMFKMHSLGETILPDEAYLSWVNSRGSSVRSLNMPGYIGGSLNSAGTKIINSNILNPEQGLPRASGITMLFDPISVHVVCLMEGAYLSSLRTASVTALAVELLQTSMTQTLAVIGAGILAQAHIELLIKRFPHIRQIHLFDLSSERIEAFKQKYAHFLSTHDVQLFISETAEEAIRSSQIVVPVTTTTEGYIRFEWLQPGALIVHVSLDDILPEVVLKADKVFVDDWHLVKSDDRRLLGRMFNSGQIVGPDDVPEQGQCQVHAQLGEIVNNGKVGRSSTDEIILMNPFGLAIEDVALATHIYQKAQALGIGTWLKR